jgi:hypothetical protein
MRIWKAYVVANYENRWCTEIATWRGQREMYRTARRIWRGGGSLSSNEKRSLSKTAYTVPLACYYRMPLFEFGAEV